MKFFELNGDFRRMLHFLDHFGAGFENKITSPHEKWP